MSTISKFANGSLIHKVTTDANGFSIWPIDSSDLAVENFQVIAREAVQYQGSDFLAVPHPQKRQPPFDMVAFIEKERE